MPEKPIAYIQSKIAIVNLRDSIVSIHILSEDESEPAVKCAKSKFKH